MAVNYLHLILMLQLAFGLFYHVFAKDNFVMTLLMPDVVSDKEDALICTGRQLGPQETYIVKFTPLVSKTIAHHMVLYGCKMPGDSIPSWTCDLDENTVYPTQAVCSGQKRQILYAWALDAPEKSLPQGVGLRVSGSTGINYLVLQLHYAKQFAAGITDHSGIALEMTYIRPPQQVGYLVLGNWGSIPPQQTAYTLDSECDFPFNYTIYPIGYRTHSHNLGVVTSGYRIRKGHWVEIGRMSPQRPQAFYDISNPGMDIRSGDVLAARCTMNSMSRATVTRIGATNHEEMCNFYIMYSTYEQENLSNTFCFKDNFIYNWLQSFKVEEIPTNAGSLDGIPGALDIAEKFKSVAIYM